MEHISKGAGKLLLHLVESQESLDTPRSSNCPACNGLGWIREPAGVRRCECGKRKIAEEQLRAIPSRFRGCSFQNYVPVDTMQQEALGKILANPGQGLFLFGGYGRGKTHLAVAQYRSLIAAGQVCLWRTMRELVHELQAAEIRDEFSVVLDRVRYADSFHLFIDDIDKFKASDWKDEALFDLFDTIYKRELAITITSNLNLSGLSEQLHPGIVRRIDDMCVGVRV